jgi:serine O-acetyltransferase
LPSLNCHAYSFVHRDVVVGAGCCVVWRADEQRARVLTLSATDVGAASVKSLDGSRAEWKTFRARLNGGLFVCFLPAGNTPSRERDAFSGMVHRVAECARLARVMECAETIMAQQQVRAGGLDKVDPVWARIRREAEEIARREPELATFIYSTILHHDTLEAAVVHRVAERLDSPQVSAELIRQAYADALEHEPAIGDAFRADIVATLDRDPATNRFLEPVLYFKGFHAIQTHRLAHWLWGRGRKDFAYYLQSQSSAVFQTDINPAVSIGRGIFLDHATGLVVGETAMIEDDVSILQEVTLGGTGKEAGDRHPKIRRGVLIGAGAKILGNIEIGHCARIAAGSVVLKSVPHNTTVAGVPARVIGEAGCPEPSRAMDHLFQDGEI